MGPMDARIGVGYGRMPLAVLHHGNDHHASCNREILRMRGSDAALPQAAPGGASFQTSTQEGAPLPGRAARYPELRYMGSKHRLLPWIHERLRELDFESAADPFTGSACVSYLLKCMDRRVCASDWLNFPATIAAATVENSTQHLDRAALRKLFGSARNGPDFIQKVFDGIFFSREDLKFLDRVCHNIGTLEHPHQQALARAALIRSCLKKQPRGVFTVAGWRYDDGRRDLRLSIEEHFAEQVEQFNEVVFDSGRPCSALSGDVFTLPFGHVDLVYLDPPYVPRADDNCYIKRYHFLEGLSCYWRDLTIMHDTKVKKIPKRFTPFSYRRTAAQAFARLFHRFKDSIVVLSYSSNAYPDLTELEALLRVHKPRVEVHERPHRYHFGTHDRVKRAWVSEYLLVGR
jgi:DNA adenine methylase/adenine-specific DNA-methyltransferase